MNRKGFTLTELILMILILGIIIVFALPNMGTGLDNQKKTQMVIDAKDMVEKTKKILLANRKYYPKNNETSLFTLNCIDPKKEIVEIQSVGKYRRNLSFVIVENTNGNYTYKVSLLLDMNSGKQYRIEPVEIDDNFNIQKVEEVNTIISNEITIDSYINELSITYNNIYETLS